MIVKVEIIEILDICTMNKSLSCSDDFAFKFALGAIKIIFNHAVLVSVGFFYKFYPSLLLLKATNPSKIFIFYLLLRGPTLSHV